MLQKWSRLYASNINGQCTNKMETERHSEQRERERMMSASPWRSSCILPASSPSISHPHIGLWCVYKYLYFCVVSVESKRCFLTDWSVWLVELSMENKRRVRLFCWNNLIIIRRQSWPSKYFIVPNSLNERICNYWTKQDILTTEQFILEADYYQNTSTLMKSGLLW